MLLEDEHGQVNLIVPHEVYERHRAIVRGEPLLLVRGRFERVGENRNILVSGLESLGALARRVAETPRSWRRSRAPTTSGTADQRAGTIRLTFGPGSRRITRSGPDGSGARWSRPLKPTPQAVPPTDVDRYAVQAKLDATSSAGV